jgi:CHASE3 domain sensor protein
MTGTQIVNDPAKGYILTGPIPDSEHEQLDLLKQAADIMSAGQGVGAPTFDHAKRIFDLVHAFMQVTITQHLSQAHEHLRTATRRLAIATWVLVVVTMFLGALEVLKVYGVIR